jgi:spore germination protein
MNYSFTRRTTVRIVTFLLAGVLIVFGLLFQYRARAIEAENRLEVQYLRGMEDLSTYLGNVETTLMKVQVTASPDTLATLSSTLWRESGFAKECLSVLPISDLNLAGTYKYLSQVGEYAVSLSDRAADGETFTEEELNTLKQLESYANEFHQEVLAAQDAVQTGSLNLLEGSKELTEADAEAEAISFTDGFEELEQSLAGCPSLVYDGPFSDHLLQQTPRMTEHAEEVSVEEAQKKAAEACGVSEEELEAGSDELSTMPCYCFQSDDGYAAVTKNGGHLCYFMKYRELGAQTLSVEECNKAAKEYLDTIGISSVRDTYYEISEGQIIFNFAHDEDGVLCYPDLVKVTVAMDNGEILRYDARGYLMNHQTREDLTAAITEEEAHEVLSPALTVQKVQMAVIPTDSGKELFCYEFQTTVDDHNVYVYVNAKTGEEEKILLLYIDENGTLSL